MIKRAIIWEENPPISIYNIYSTSVLLYSNNHKILVRCAGSSVPPFYRNISNRRYLSTVSSPKLHDSNTEVTCEEINNLLIVQGLSITQAELDRLKSIPGVKFDLPIIDEVYPAFAALVGRPKYKG